jgi:hypothetical protein
LPRLSPVLNICRYRFAGSRSYLRLLPASTSRAAYFCREFFRRPLSERFIPVRPWDEHEFPPH